MRRSHRGVTLTELLVVISVMAILTSFVTPFVISVRHVAVGRVCTSNMRELYTGVQLYAKLRLGRVPQCYVMSGNAVVENRWWYNQVAEVLYPGKDQNPLTMNVKKFRPEHCMLRCPASRDNYNSTYAPRAEGGRTVKIGSSTVNIDHLSGADKDRCYDQCYGYNNMGFAYSQSGAILPNPDDPKQVPANSYPVGIFYHDGGVGAISGGYTETAATATAAGTTYMGRYANVREASRTILLMDYAKADAQPFPGRDGLFGYSFRHGGRANVLFVDGHIEIHSKSSLLAGIGTPDPTTRRSRIHWTVLRP